MKYVFCLLFGFASVLLPLSVPADNHQPIRPLLERYTGDFDSLRQRFHKESLANPRSPEDYLMGKFNEHDVIFLGESHHQPHITAFLTNLLPRLQQAGYGLAIEFTEAADQKKLDQLLAGKNFDTGLANLLLRKVYFYQSVGYRDVLEAIWRLNRNLPAGQIPLRVIALDQSELGYGAWERAQLRPGETSRDAAVIERILMQRGLMNTRDYVWASIIMREFVNKSQKVLVHGGSSHTTTRFLRDKRRNVPGDRQFYLTAGNLVYNQIGSRAISIFIHDDEEPSYRLMMVEDLLGDKKYIRFGMDLKNTVLGALPSFFDGFSPDATRQNLEGYTLADVADGYIYLLPKEKWTLHKCIENLYGDPRVFEFAAESLRLGKGDLNLEVTPEMLQKRDIEEEGVSGTCEP